MAFGMGFKHEEGNQGLEPGNYTAKIETAEIKDGNYGSYIQGTVSVNGSKAVYPNIFMLRDSPKAGFGDLSLEQALHIWNVNMTKFFSSFGIKEGDFDPTHWVGKTGTITVQVQKKKPEYKEIVMWKKEPAKVESAPAPQKPASTVAPSTVPAEEKSDGFPEDLPF